MEPINTQHLADYVWGWGGVSPIKMGVQSAQSPHSHFKWTCPKSQIIRYPGEKMTKRTSQNILDLSRAQNNINQDQGMAIYFSKILPTTNHYHPSPSWISNDSPPPSQDMSWAHYTTIRHLIMPGLSSFGNRLALCYNMTIGLCWAC